MAENPIAGALSNIGRTFRDISTSRLERQRLDLAGQQQEFGQVRALEALRLQGQGQVAEQELALVQEQAAQRQLTREFGLKERQFGLQEREARSLETLREGQLDVSRGGLEVSRQQAANQAAFQRGQLAIGARNAAVQEQQEQRAERAFALSAETRTLNKQVLQNQLAQSNLSLDEQQRKAQLFDTEIPIADLRTIFLSQGVPKANVDASILGIETMKRAISGPDVDVSDRISYGDAVTFGAFVTQAMKLVETGDDKEALKMAFDMVDKVAGEDATTEERLQIGQELYLSLKDPQGTKHRFELGDYNRQVTNAMAVAAEQTGVNLERLSAEQRTQFKQQVEMALQTSYQQSGRALPQGVQPLAPGGQSQAAPAPVAPPPQQPGGALVPLSQTPEEIGIVSPPTAPPTAPPQTGLLTFTPGQSARGGVRAGQAAVPSRVLVPLTPGLTARGTMRAEPVAPPVSQEPQAVAIPDVQATTGGQASAEGALQALPPPAAPGVLPNLSPEEIRALWVGLQRGEDPEAVIQALANAGMNPDLARQAVTTNQLQALRQAVIDETNTALNRQALEQERVLRPILQQQGR